MTTQYFYGPGGVLLGEYDSSGTLIREYIYANGEPLAQIDAGSPETILYLHTDHLLTARYATDASGSTVWTWDSDAFGVGAPTGTTTVNLRFPGQYFDSETGLHYNWSRYYNPATGRFITSDPLGIAAGLNLYNYGRQNPLMNFDLRGLKDQPFDPNKHKNLDNPPTVPSIDDSYNCVGHSMCENKGWVDQPFADWLLWNCWEMLDDDAANRPGDIIVYEDKNGGFVHVATVTEVDEEGNTTEVESKVGRAKGEHRHHPRAPGVDEAFTNDKGVHQIQGRRYYRRKPSCNRPVIPAWGLPVMCGPGNLGGGGGL